MNYVRRKRRGSPQAIAQGLYDVLKERGNGARFQSRRWEAWLMANLDVATPQSAWNWTRFLENLGFIRRMENGDVRLLVPPNPKEPFIEPKTGPKTPSKAGLP